MIITININIIGSKSGLTSPLSSLDLSDDDQLGETANTQLIDNPTFWNELSEFHQEISKLINLQKLEI